MQAKALITRDDQSFKIDLSSCPRQHPIKCSSAPILVGLVLVQNSRLFAIRFLGGPTHYVRGINPQV